MRIPTKIIVFTALFAVSTVSAQGWAAPPTRVCAIGSYQCPDHAQIHASWPVRCPRCGAVLAAAPGGSAGGASGGAGTAGAGGRAGGSTMGSGQAQYRVRPEQQDKGKADCGPGCALRREPSIRGGTPVRRSTR